MLLPCIWVRARNINEECNQLFTKTDTAAIRGVSAIFVMVAHYSIWFNQLSEVTMNKLVILPLEQLGGIGVLLFFFASGYGINESYGKKDNITGYLTKRFWGVYVPYILMKLITNTMLIVTKLIPNDSKVLLSYLAILGIPDWFIFVIILQYVSYYLARKYFPKYDLLFSVVADTVMTFIFVVQNRPIGWFNALWLFTFGILVSRYQHEIMGIINKSRLLVLLTSFIGFCLLGAVFALFKGNSWANFIKPIAGMLLSLSFCSIFRWIKLENRVVLWFGKCSLYLYIVHIAVWDIVTKYVVNIRLSLLMAIVLSFLLTEVVFRIVSTAVVQLRKAFSIDNHKMKT